MRPASAAPTLSLHFYSSVNKPLAVRSTHSGANLAMWMRVKYPWVVSGAIASSVSVQKHLLRRSNIFWQIVTEAYVLLTVHKYIIALLAG